MDEDLDSHFARLVSDTRAADAVRERVRERHLRDAASADATMLGLLVDLAEEGGAVTVALDIGRTVAGRITMVTPDAVVIGSSYVPLRALVTIRRPPGRMSVRSPSGQRAAPSETSFGALLGELALVRPRVAVGARGEPVLLTGELQGAGVDVLSLRLDGEPPIATYVALASVSLVTLLASG